MSVTSLLVQSPELYVLAPAVALAVVIGAVVSSCTSCTPKFQALARDVRMVIATSPPVRVSLLATQGLGWAELPEGSVHSPTSVPFLKTWIEFGSVPAGTKEESDREASR